MNPLLQHRFRSPILPGVGVAVAFLAWAGVASSGLHNDSSAMCAIVASAVATTWTILLARKHRLMSEALRKLQEQVKEREEIAHAAEEQLRSAAFELESARQLADAASSAKSDFLARMSHEIRTPMTAILGYASKILDVGDDPVQRRDCVRIVHRSGEHLLKLINDILDLSKVEAGKMTCEQVSCSPASVLAEVASIMRVRAIEKGLDFRVDHHGALPEKVVTDPTRLRQILLNLIGNAIKFTDKGTVCALLTMTRDQHGSDLVEYKITDSGIGMDPGTLQRLFQPFEQGDRSMARRFGGTGLGLVVSRKLAQLLGGDIAVDSVPGKGSTFTVLLPTGDLAGIQWTDNPQQLYMTAPEPIEAAANPELLTGKRILLADDTELNRELVSYMLSRFGAEVEEAMDGVEAVEMALDARKRNVPFDMVLMDVEMPVLDGYSAAQRLRLHGYEGPILALTAHAMSDVRAKCLEAGCNDFLTKPVNPTELALKIHAHVNPRLAA